MHPGAPLLGAPVASAALVGCGVQAEAGSTELLGGGGKRGRGGRVGGGKEEEEVVVEVEEEEVWSAERTSAAVTWVAGDIALHASSGLQSPDPGQPI